MCKAPKPATPKEPKKPEFLRNKYLDEFVGEASAVKSLKTGRASLRIPLSGPDTVTPPSGDGNGFGDTVLPTGRGPRPIAPRVGQRRVVEPGDVRRQLR